MPESMINDLLKAVVKSNEMGYFLEPWIELQRYKRYHPLGIRFAKWWLRVRYRWDDDKEQFIPKQKGETNG